MLLTLQQSWQARLALPEPVIEPQDAEKLRFYTVWIPVTWGDSPMTSDVSEADDWKDDVIPAASLQEAEAIAAHALGSAEITKWEVEEAE